MRMGMGLVVHAVAWPRKVIFRFSETWDDQDDQCDQSNKASTCVNYDSTLVISSKLLIFTTLEL